MIPNTKRCWAIGKPVDMGVPPNAVHFAPGRERGHLARFVNDAGKMPALL